MLKTRNTTLPRTGKTWTTQTILMTSITWKTSTKLQSNYNLLLDYHVVVTIHTSRPNFNKSLSTNRSVIYFSFSPLVRNLLPATYGPNPILQLQCMIVVFFMEMLWLKCYISCLPLLLLVSRGHTLRFQQRIWGTWLYLTHSAGMHYCIIINVLMRS